MHYAPFESHTIAVIAGGGGGSTMVAGLEKHLPEASLDMIVPMADSGGSTGRLREQFDTLPVGDIRRTIASAAGSAAVGALLNFRFGPQDSYETLEAVAQELGEAVRRDVPESDSTRTRQVVEQGVHIGQRTEGGLKGHSFGNFVLTALALERGIDEASVELSAVVGVRSKTRVIPVTTEPHNLVMWDGRHMVYGEHAIDEHRVYDSDRAFVWLDPVSTPANPRAEQAVRSADLVFIGPGSPYTSLAPALLVDGMQDALRRQGDEGGKLFAVTNLMTQEHDTNRWCVGKYAQCIQRYAGNRALDGIVYNDATHLVEDAVMYDPEFMAEVGVDAVPAPLVGGAAHKDANDAVRRSAVNHDMGALVATMHARRELFSPRRVAA